MEIRMCEVGLAGRIASRIVSTSDGSDNQKAHFMLDALEEGNPIQCYCEGETAENLLKFCEEGDEISCEGSLQHYQFSNEKAPRLLVKVRYISYGRKRRTLR